MKKLTFDYASARPFVGAHEIAHLSPQVMAAARLLESQSGPGKEFTGWLNLPVQYD
ncbi:MAG: glucose-6-phosphate isomerase, partial [Bacteroidetes bacterium]